MRSHSDPQRANQRALAFLRICVGILFLIFGEYKVLGRNLLCTEDLNSGLTSFCRVGHIRSWPRFCGGWCCHMARPIAFLVAYGELSIGIALTLGVWVRRASGFGLLFMVTLLLASDYPGAGAPMWQYFGASLDHSVLGIVLWRF